MEEQNIPGLKIDPKKTNAKVTEKNENEDKNLKPSNINSNSKEANSKVAEENDNKAKDSKPSNINSEEVDEETLSKLRGDAIGDTMYSQSSVIRILLQLSDVEWNDKLEEDLCFLWDMTLERDVCEYLYQLSFPSIATAIILKYSEPRLIEIIIGILGNICSNSEIPPDITDVEISIVLNALDTDDHLILIQIMRFLTAITYHRNTKLHFISSEIMEKICFILSNSTNKELLLHTMETLSKITADFKIENELMNENILNSLLIAYSFINKKKSDNNDEFDSDTDEERKHLNLFIEVIVNICFYLNEMTHCDMHKEICAKNEQLLIEFRKIIKGLVKEENLVPPSQDVVFYFDCFTIIFPVLNIRYDKDIFIYLLNIIVILVKKEADKIDVFIELIRYLISRAEVSSIIKDCENTNCDNITTFKLILEHKSKCDYDYKENILSIIEKLENVK